MNRLYTLSVFIDERFQILAIQDFELHTGSSDDALILELFQLLIETGAIDP